MRHIPVGRRTLGHATEHAISDASAVGAAPDGGSPAWAAPEIVAVAGSKTTDDDHEEGDQDGGAHRALSVLVRQRFMRSQNEWMSDGPQDADARSQLERMLAGDLYNADNRELAEAGLKASGLTERFNQSRAHDTEERLRILRELLGALGEDTEIRPPFYCEYGFQLLIGARTFVNFGLMALDVATITIGDDVQIGPNVQLLTPTHPIEPELRRSKLEAALPITIADNAWLGGGVIVLPGVSVGANTVVGAGSVVVKDLPANVVAVGNPARIVRVLE
jgi:maltose O-acetyltransferase